MLSSLSLSRIKQRLEPTATAEMPLVSVQTGAAPANGDGYNGGGETEGRRGRRRRTVCQTLNVIFTALIKAINDRLITFEYRPRAVVELRECAYTTLWLVKVVM
jgi:hypothetical protein